MGATESKPETMASDSCGGQEAEMTIFKLKKLVQADYYPKEEEVKAIWDKYDVDGSQRLCCVEVKKFYTDLLHLIHAKQHEDGGYQWQPSFDEFMQSLDRDGDGYVDYREFRSYGAKLKNII